MLKSMFAKYLIAIVIIILISFLALSALITSMIEAHLNENKEDNLISASSAIESHVKKYNPDLIDMELYAQSLAPILTPFIDYHDELDVIITDEAGKVCLSTLGVLPDENGTRVPITSGALGAINIFEIFEVKNTPNNSSYLVHYGDLDGLVNNKHVACAKAIVTNGEVRGYVISFASSAKEAGIVSITRKTVINSSVWVMLAAVIAVYFITERITHPLKNMTSAAKQLAKGDFKSRVVVDGKDEVAELGNAFNNMAESLESLDKMRNSFLASVSHDLRTPMTTISGFIEGITSGAIPQEKHDYYLGVISAEVHRLSRLVSQLLDVSRLESGDRKFNFENFDIAEVGRIILISFEQKIEDKNLDVEFDTENDEMPAFADKDAIYQVMYNLCHNAIKFANEGGKFAIRFTRCSGKIKVSVFNEGQNIPKEDLPMVFERFYKSDKSRGLDKTGVGLGLYISKTIIDAHGEEIHVESEENAGTEFWFTLKEGESTKRRTAN